MNRNFFFHLLFAVFFLSFIAAVNADADGPDLFNLSSGSDVVLHESADISSVTVTIIPKGSRKIRNLGCKDGASFTEWQAMPDEERQSNSRQRLCHVEYDGWQGWLQGDVLAEYTPEKTPSFSCRSDGHEAEMRICENPDLIELDLKLASVWEQVILKAKALDDRPDQIVADLKAEQKGWIGGRNECWKAQEIGVENCIRDSYERRISELQAYWGLVPKNKNSPLFYECEGDDRYSFYLTEFEGTPLPSALIDIGDTRLPLVASAPTNGMRYDANLYGRYVWKRGEEALFVWDQFKPEVKCKLVDAEN